ncbi:MAG TPA: diaminopimelate epimerase [Candidatus Coprenecus stercoravium]|uniref:Diaminopimelate epimerase n=1 Tax=Candidatus Coprenecus stercoravium TaxID=2840735 RepID=A0A9D2GPM8_9BACT|nr:diaminopimelate epimerase [Candidatus Coprenecus stercoravium]
MDFFKYQAAGNDFILVRSVDSRNALSAQDVIHLCDRRYGIGADGLIIMEADPEHDFSMRFYNNDGSGGMMCGNGGRCIVDLAFRSGIIPKNGGQSWTFSAPDGVHTGRIISADGNKSTVLLSMNDIADAETLSLSGGTAYRMNTGTDHLVIFRDDLDSLDIMTEGRRWRYDSRFAPKGVNVNFVQISAPGEPLRVRTYEKGVEYETLSCGTGIIASAAAAWLRGDHSGKYTLRSTSDTFTVSLSCRSGIFSDVELTGPVELVFQALL